MKFYGINRSICYAMLKSIWITNFFQSFKLYMSIYILINLYFCWNFWCNAGRTLLITYYIKVVLWLCVCWCFVGWVVVLYFQLCYIFVFVLLKALCVYALCGIISEHEAGYLHGHDVPWCLFEYITLSSDVLHILFRVCAYAPIYFFSWLQIILKIGFFTFWICVI
jgi:hypothetical protein